MKYFLLFIFVSFSLKASEFKREFFEAHSYIMIKDDRGLYHFIHDPDCNCDSVHVIVKKEYGTYILKVPVSEYD